MPKAKNDVQDMSINDPLQKISVKMTFYFSIFKQSILDFFWELPRYHLSLILETFISQKSSSGLNAKFHYIQSLFTRESYEIEQNRIKLTKNW